MLNGKHVCGDVSIGNWLCRPFSIEVGKIACRLFPSLSQFWCVVVVAACAIHGLLTDTVCKSWCPSKLAKPFVVDALFGV